MKTHYVGEITPPIPIKVTSSNGITLITLGVQVQSKLFQLHNDR